MVPKEDGKVSNSVACVRSLSVLGCPGNGVFPCKDVMDAVEWAENDGELE